MIRAAVAAALVLSLAACGGESADAVAAGGALTEAECTLLFDRALDQAVHDAPAAEQKEQLRSFMTAGKGMTIASCQEGEIYDREAYDCVTRAAAGSTDSHACIVAANSR